MVLLETQRAIPFEQQRRIAQRLSFCRLTQQDGYHEAVIQLAAGDPTAVALWSRPLSPKERQERKRLIFELWLAGYTEEEIASKVLISQQNVHKSIALTPKKTHIMGVKEQPPTYNVWNFNTCDPRFGQQYPGRIPGQAIINLLLWLTKPYDLIVDPMAGGGTTLDVCKYLSRRYRCYDIDPCRQDIEQWNISNGYPRLSRKPDLILLDPPYWRLKREKYSSDGSAMGSYDDWLQFIRKLAVDTYKALRPGGYTALFIQSFFDERENKRFLFLNGDCLNLFKKAKFVGIQEISVNMPSQIKSFRDVTYAKRKGILLDLKREVFVFQKPDNVSER